MDCKVSSRKRTKKILVSVSPVVEIHPRDYIGSEKCVYMGRVISKSVIMTDDPSKRYDGFESDAFALENLLANGVDLKEIKMSSSLFVAHDSLVERMIERSNSVVTSESRNVESVKSE